jgi:TPR repeat protein
MRVGEAYLNGTATERSLDQALSFLQESANSGNAMAQFYLGTMYEHGLATPINPAISAPAPASRRHARPR